jgi:acetylornithine deacetylase/succinyl-diaminopimelate desuccinylase-like protein
MVRVLPPIPLVAGDTGAALYDAARASAADVLQLAAEIARIPAPTGDEAERSSFVEAVMRRLSFEGVRTDGIGDVTGIVPGINPDRKLLIAAHLDTVFTRKTDLQIVIWPDRSFWPGLGDNSLGVAAALTLPRMLALAGVRAATDVLVTGNVGEEGLGDLRGMKAVMDANPDVGAVIALEGHNLGRVTHVAVGSRRYRVRVSGPGGHSWGDHGNPSAIDVAAAIIGSLSLITLPSTPKTTLNVGTIEGGISVNTIAPSATFLLDLRSVDESALRTLAAQVETKLRRVPAGITAEFDLIGERPAGVVPAESRIIRLASSILESIDIQPVGDASSTDANIPISRGVPAVCIGLTTGGNVHREDEYIDNAPISDGLYQFLALTVATAGFLAQGQL